MYVWVLVQLPVKFSLNLGAGLGYFQNSFKFSLEIVSISFSIS